MFMAQKTGKKNFGADLDAEAVDRFGAWCDVEKLARGGAADGLADLLPEPAKREKAMDPAKLDLGQRTDHRTPHQRRRPE